MAFFFSQCVHEQKENMIANKLPRAAGDLDGNILLEQGALHRVNRQRAEICRRRGFEDGLATAQDTRVICQSGFIPIDRDALDADRAAAARLAKAQNSLWRVFAHERFEHTRRAAVFAGQDVACNAPISYLLPVQRACNRGAGVELLITRVVAKGLKPSQQKCFERFERFA